VDPGFRTAGITAVHVALPAARYQGSAPKRQFFVDLLERVRALPGVTAAGAVSVLPMSPLGVQFTIPFTIDGLDVASPSERPTAGYRGVLAGYFETMGIPVVNGRTFDAFDGRDGGTRVAIINETAAARYFPGADPIGRMIRMPMAGDLQIVGVAGDVRQGGLQAPAAAEVFVPYYQLAISEMQVVVASDRPPDEIARAVRPLVSGLDPLLPIGKVSALDDLVAASIAQPRFNMALLIGLALSAALLAAVGVYGIVAYAVSRRTPEIGLRIALGAGAGETFRLVVGGAVRLVAIGIGLGLAGAAVAAQWFDSLLFGVPAIDPATLVAAGLALAVVGFVAASLPAARAARIDPVGALRGD
jgi:predicted permease